MTMYSAKLKINIDKNQNKFLEKNTNNKNLIMEWLERSIDLNYYDLKTDGKHIINMSLENKSVNCKIICSTISEYNSLLKEIYKKKKVLSKTKVGIIYV